MELLLRNMGIKITMERVLNNIFVVKKKVIKLEGILYLPEDLNFVLFLFTRKYTINHPFEFRWWYIEEPIKNVACNVVEYLTRPDLETGTHTANRNKGLLPVF